MQIFYAPEIEDGLKLPEDEARHCFKVLRKRSGDIITVINGRGSFYECRLSGSTLGNHELEIVGKSEESRGRKHRIHIAIAPTKSMDRMEWFVEKAVEIGIDEISFILCERSERKVIKPERLSRKAISAAKQSLRATIPQVNALRPLHDFIEKQTLPDDQLLIAHLSDDSISITTVEHGSTLLLIGPEGDFSQKEMAACIHAGYRPVRMGNSRLRTETAGIVACTLLNIQ